MQAQHRLFLSLLDGSVHYAIPRSQRRYAWKPGNIDALLANLRTAAGRALLRRATQPRTGVSE